MELVQSYVHSGFVDDYFTDYSTKPGVLPPKGSAVLVRNSALSPDVPDNAVLIFRRLNRLLASIRSKDSDTDDWTTILHLPGRIAAGEAIRLRMQRSRLDAVVVLLTCSEGTPDWLRESARSIRELTGFWTDDDESSLLSVDRAISGLKLLSEVSAVLRGRPFVYPSPGDSVTIELIGKRDRVTIIHDAHGNQLIRSTPFGVSSALYEDDTKGREAMRDAIESFDGA